MVFPDFILAMIKEHAKELPLIAGKPKKPERPQKTFRHVFIPLPCMRSRSRPSSGKPSVSPHTL
jgi:hypothetical protein